MIGILYFIIQKTKKVIKIENITIGQIGIWLGFIVTFVGSIVAILRYAKQVNNKILEPINQKLTKMDSDHLKKLENLELSSIKTDLVNFINDLEHNVPKSQIQKMNAHELYDRYSELGGNSYVHDHWEKLKKEGKV